MGKLRIHHPYGKIAKLPWEDSDGLAFGGDPFGNAIDLVHLSKNIRTYNEEVEQSEKLTEALNWIESAARVVFLGFHFHDQNVELIKAKSSTNDHVVYGTILHRSPPEVSIIKGQISRIVSRVQNAYLERTECNQLFSSYGTTLTH